MQRFSRRHRNPPAITAAGVGAAGVVVVSVMPPRIAAVLALCATLAAGATLAMPARAESADPQASTAAAGSAEAPPPTDAPAVERPVDRAPERPAEPAFRTAETASAPPVRTRQPSVDPQVAEFGHTVAALSGDLKRLQDDNEQLEGANQRLTELNAQLRQEVESLGLELQTARERANQRWVLYGAGLVLLGLLAGVLLKARPRRSAWS
jgi:hypothetical protein